MKLQDLGERSESIDVMATHGLILGAIRKTDQMHVMPLSGAAIEILEQVEAVKKSSIM